MEIESSSGSDPFLLCDWKPGHQHKGHLKILSRKTKQDNLGEDPWLGQGKLLINRVKGKQKMLPGEAINHRNYYIKAEHWTV